MNEIVNAELATAQQVHTEALANVSQLASSYVGMSKALKRMRDEKLYIQLGYESFDIYVDGNYPFKARQAYKFISHIETYGQDFLERHSSLGVEKLELLKGVFSGDREEIIEKNDLSDMTVSEVKALVDKIKNLGEQMSLLEAENEELKSKPIEVAVAEPSKTELAEIRKKIKKEEAEKSKAVLEKALEEERRKADDYSKKLEKKHKEEKAALEAEATRKLAEQAAMHREALARASELEEKLDKAKHDGAAKLRIYFEQVQDYIEKMLAELEEITDAESKSRFAESIADLGKMISDTVAGYRND